MYHGEQGKIRGKNLKSILKKTKASSRHLILNKCDLYVEDTYWQWHNT